MNAVTDTLLEKLLALRTALDESPADASRAGLLIERLQELGECAADAGFPALLDICLLFKEGLAALPGGADLATEDASLLAAWPDRIIDYIATHASAPAKDALMSTLYHATWSSAVSADTSELLRAMLDIVPDLSELAGRAAGMQRLATAASGDNEAEEAWASLDTGMSAEVPPPLRELIEIMIGELKNLHAGILKLQQSGSGAALEKAAQELAVSLEFYSEAVKSIDFQGLGEVVARTREHVLALPAVEEERRVRALALLADWPAVLLGYLRNPVAPGAATGMIGMLQDPAAWPAPLDEAQAAALVATFGAQQYAVKDDRPQRKRAATPEDVSLALQDDVSRDLLDGMLAELPAQTEQFSGAVQRLIKGGTLEDIMIAKRIAHTLKGAGNTVGIRGIATLTHNLEDILLALSKNERLPGPCIAATLMTASDCLAAMSESLLGMGDPPEDAEAVLQEVLDLAGQIDTEGIDAVNTAAVAPSRTAAPAAAPEKPQEPPERELAAVVRVSAEVIDNLLRLAGETIIMTDQIHNGIKVMQAELKELKNNFDLLKQLGARVEQIIDIRDLNQMQAGPGNGNDKYDALEMDRYSDLHLYSRQLVEMAMDAHEMGVSIDKGLTRLEDMLAEQSRLNDETQEGVMRVRMLPVSSQFPRLQRCVRQAEKMTGKTVSLHLAGGDTLMDNDALVNLLDPVMHLLRNAVDHGMEAEEERRAAGKGAHGNIHLEFARTGNNIVVRCRDDGRGLDLEAIRRKAVEQGLLRADQKATEEELRQFIMRSGFSTRNKTTQVSGRGIGMDAVNAAILALGGTLRLDSKAGQGCQFEIKIPQNLISMHTLLLRVGPRIISLANRGIARIIYHENGSLAGNGGERVYATDGYEYPALNLESLLNIETDRRATKRRPPTAILFHDEQVAAGMRAVLVDKIIGTADLVVKELGCHVPKIAGVLGVAILGDGNVTPVLDVPELLRYRDAGGAAGLAARTDYRRAHMPTALVVDDSLSARKALEQFMQDAGYLVRSARDGLEAFDMIKVHKPDILLSDLEMPRMNGMELIAHVRADQNLADIPVIMITSRAAAKHRQEAMEAGVNIYLTKPFGEEELLEHIHSLRKAH